jgi:DNA-binding transcriptional MerR regulator/methylmalonyl-CoA mutase cobalamin-binding subunit
MQYTVKAAARATGVSEARLRTWERRYGVPKPQRSPTGRRLYEEADIAVIRRMATLVGEGLSAAQAAAAALASDDAVRVVPEAPAPLHPLAVEIAEAAARYAEADLRRPLAAAVAELGWATAIDEVIFPALREIGDRWERADVTPAHEHFASQLARAEIVAALHKLDPLDPGQPSVLLACPAGEEHELGVLAIALLLGQSGVRVTQLGANVPTTNLIEAAQATEPAAIGLAATSSTSLPTLGLAARAVIHTRLDATLFVGGPALRDRSLTESIPGVLLPHTVPAAAEVLIAAAG